MEIVDRRYIGIVGFQLDNFKWLKPDLANASCPICGDSQKNKLKARLYFFPKYGKYLAKCHNCGLSTTFGSFLKEVNPNLYSQYLLELLTEKDSKFEPIENKKDFLLDEDKIFGFLTKINDLANEHPTKQYVRNRKIPFTKYSYLYHTDNIIEIAKLFDVEIKVQEPKLILPLRNRKKELIGLQARSIQKYTKLRYITLKKNDDPKYFGLESLDMNKEIIVVEGPIDSLFLDNSTAFVGLSSSAMDFFDSESTYVALDNEPRNKEVVKTMKKISEKFKVCVWPKNLKQKDINDMVLAGYTGQQIQNYIKNNSHKGLAFKAKLLNWAKV